MIKYLQEHYGLTNSERKLLYQNGTTLFEQVQNDGGFINVYSQHKIPQYFDNEWLELYKNKIIRWEYKDYDNEDELNVINGSLLQRPYYFTNEYILQIYQLASITKLHNWVSVMKFSKYQIEILNLYFNAETLIENHGNEELLQIVPVFKEFGCQEFQQSLQSCTLKDIVNLMNCQQQEQQNLCCVEFSLKNWIHELEHLQEQMPYCSVGREEDSVLSYLRQNFDGINIPILTLRTSNAWSGGSQEDLCFNLININHGPNTQIWIIVDGEEVIKLREMILKQQEIDIFQKKGLWFKEPIYFLSNKIKFTYLKQQVGEVVFLKSQCMYWIKSSGFNISTSWNQASINDETLLIMTQRYDINCELGIHSRIPYKGLILDIIMHYVQLQQSTIKKLRDKMKQLFSQENDKMKQTHTDIFELEVDAKHIQSCSKCKGELFLYYYKDNNTEDLCLNCVLRLTEINDLKLILKYPLNCFYKLVNAKPMNCDRQYCSHYVGRTLCTLQNEFENEQSSQCISEKVKTRGKQFIDNINPLNKKLKQ